MKRDEMKGACILSICGMLYSLYSVYSRFMGGSFAPFYQLWTRALIIVIGLGIASIFFKLNKHISRPDWKWFSIVGLTGAFGDVLFYIAVNTLPIGQALFGFFTISTISSYIWGSILYKEKLTSSKKLSIVIAIIGLVLMYWNSFARISLTPTAFLAVVGAGVLVSTSFTLSKKVSSTYSFLHIALMNNIFGFVGMLIVSMYLREAMYTNFMSFPWMINILFTLTQAATMSLIVLGFKYIEAQKGGLFLLLELVFGLLFAAMFFGEFPTTASLIGSFLLIVAMGLPMIRSQL
jgi:drug/metabolite transporter (DMT)-like permease